jgi:hypothetical protein
MTPERIEQLSTTGEEIRGDDVRALAGIAMAACERLAIEAPCPACVHLSFRQQWNCRKCSGHMGRRWGAWQDACRGLGAG